MPVRFKIIDHGWVSEFAEAVKLGVGDLLIVSPFIKEATARRLTVGASRVRVLTRFNEQHYLEGVADLSALRHLLRVGASVRGVKNLHAKLYVFGNKRIILTSANLTEAALTRNHELGMVTDNPDAIERCQHYFDVLWSKAGKNLTANDVAGWEKRINSARRTVVSTPLNLRDHGANLGFMPDEPPPSIKPNLTQQAFVKFFGKSDGRSDLNTPVMFEIEQSESHWALSYPRGKRPRQVDDGDIMFIGRMVHSPNDTAVYGRAVAYRHVPRRDDASAEDKRRTNWKAKWPHYIRIRDPEFVAGALSNGISLIRLMDELGADSFLSTARHKRDGSGNTNPRKALMRKAQIPLTRKAANWLNARFEEALAKHGRISVAQLERLYSPALVIEQVSD
jgi:hypothetical protein